MWPRRCPHVATPARPARRPRRGDSRDRGRRRAGRLTTGGVAAQLRRMLRAGELDLPLPGAGQTARRWAALAGWGGRDLSLARLAEGHVDAARDPRRGRSRPGAGRSLRRLGVALRWRRGAARAAPDVPRAARGRCGSARAPGCSTGRSSWRTRAGSAVRPTAAPRRGRPRGRRRARARHLVHRRDGGRRHAGRRLRRRARSPTPHWSASPAGTSRAPGSRSAGPGSRPCGGAAPPGCSTACSATSRPCTRTRTSSPTSASCTPPWPPRTRCSRQTAAAVDADPAADHGARRRHRPRGRRARRRGGGRPRAADRRAGPLSRDAEPGPRAGGPGALRPPAPRRARPRRAGRAGRRPVAHGVSDTHRRRPPGP